MVEAASGHAGSVAERMYVRLLRLSARNYLFQLRYVAWSGQFVLFAELEIGRGKRNSC